MQVLTSGEGVAEGEAMRGTMCGVEMVGVQTKVAIAIVRIKETVVLVGKVVVIVVEVVVEVVAPERPVETSDGLLVRHHLHAKRLHVKALFVSPRVTEPGK